MTKRTLRARRWLFNGSVCVTTLALVLGTLLPSEVEPVRSICIGAVATAVSVVLLFYVFRPRIEIRPTIAAKSANPEPTELEVAKLKSALRVDSLPEPGWQPGDRYLFQFRNVGWLPVYDVTTHARIRIKMVGTGNIWRTVEVPMSGGDKPSLAGSSRVWLYARLSLAQVNWARYMPPNRWPSSPLDLKSILNEFDALLEVRVTATTRAFQISASRAKLFSSAEIGSNDDVNS